MSSCLIWLEEMEKHLEGDMARRRTSVCNKSQISAWVHAWFSVDARRCAGGNPAWPFPAQICGTSKNHCPHLPRVPCILGIPIPHMLGNVNSRSSIIYPCLAILYLYFEHRRTHEDGFVTPPIINCFVKKGKNLLFHKPWHSPSQLDSFR